MSFTADELQSFNDVLDKKLSAHRRDMERLFDQRLNKFRQELDQRLIASQQEIIRVLAQKLNEQQSGMATILQQQLTDVQMRIAQTVSQEVRLRQTQQTQQIPETEPTEQIESVIDRSLAAQLLAIEELLNQRIVYQSPEEVAMSLVSGEYGPQFEAIEVQTELPWEDLMEVFGKALDDRFATLSDKSQTATQRLEHQLSSRISALQQQLFDELSHRQAHSYGGTLTNVQEVFQSIEQLERIIESMQVAMTTNLALLSNRLFHHQQLPLERAHPANTTHAGSDTSNTGAVQSPNGMSNSLLQPTKERQEP